MLIAALVFFGLVLLNLIVESDKKAKQKEKFKEARNYVPRNSHGGAHFVTDNKTLEKAGLFDGDGVAIGYSPDGRHALHYPGFFHLLTIAAARCGKGATLIINALLSWKNSIVVIDPKAENAVVTSRFRRRFGKVYILNPFKMFWNELKDMHARFNPMAVLVAAALSFHADCDKLAAALVWDEGKEGFHFTASARLLVSGVIAALIRHGKQPADKTLVTVARVISSDVFTFCRQVVASTTDPFIIQKLGRYAAPDAEKSKEVVDVIATAITQLGFMGNAAIAESLSGSDFRFSDLKRKPGMTVYICLPLSKLDICDKYFRLILETAISDLLNEGVM